MSARAKKDVIEALNEGDIMELQEVRDDVAALRVEVEKFGRRLDMLDSKLELLDDLQREQRYNAKRLGDAFDLLEYEKGPFTYDVHNG